MFFVLLIILPSFEPHFMNHFITPYLHFFRFKTILFIPILLLAPYAMTQESFHLDYSVYF